MNRVRILAMTLLLSSYSALAQEHVSLNTAQLVDRCAASLDGLNTSTAAIAFARMFQSAFRQLRGEAHGEARGGVSLNGAIEIEMDVTMPPLRSEKYIEVSTTALSHNCDRATDGWQTSTAAIAAAEMFQSAFRQLDLEIHGEATGGIANNGSIILKMNVAPTISNADSGPAG